LRVHAAHLHHQRRGNRVRITDFKGPELARIRWSPDGKSLIFDASNDQGTDLYIVPAVAGGKPARVQLGAMNGSWSHWLQGGEIRKPAGTLNSSAAVA
jgi:hypothetical protein